MKAARLKNTPPTALAIAIAAIVAPPLTHAQTLEEVIVTAQKKAESLTSAPVAVTAVSGETIKDLSIFQADELNKLVTGMEVRYEGDSNVGVGLRGVGTFQQQSAPARVGVYMDDYYMASQASFALGSMFDMSSVQILKGPQGTLYGQPSPTGAMILGTGDPNFDGINGYMQGSYVADPEGYNVQGAVNVPLTDQVAVRFAGLSDDRETGTEDINPLNKVDEERNRDGARVKVLWEPTDTFNAKLGYTYMETDDTEAYRILESIDEGDPGYVGEPGFDVEADDRAATADSPRDVKFQKWHFATLHLGWQLGDYDIKWFTGNLDTKLENDFDQDQTDIPSALIKQKTLTGNDGEALQSELRVSSSAFDIWDWTLGAYYQKSESRTDVDTLANRPENGGVFNVKLDIPLDTEIWALFTHNTIAITENTDLVLGVRYTEFDQTDDTVIDGDFFLGSELLPGGEMTDGVFLPSVFPCIDGTAAPCAAGAGDFGWEEWTGTVKLAHYFSDELNAYVTLDRGFRPGAPNFDTTGIFQPDLNFYDGEEVNSIELGAKGDLFDGRARYTAAIFYSVYDDYQVPITNLTAYNIVTGEVGVPPAAAFVNVDEATQRGFEADFRMLVTDNWMVYAGVTYANVEFTDGEVPCTDSSQAPVGPDNRFNSCDADGEVASAQPEWTGVIQSEYSWPGLAFGNEVYVSGLWSYRGDTESPGDVEGRLDTDDFSVLDLYTGIRNEAWSAQVFVKNVFDDDGIVSKRPTNFSYNEITVTAPQTVGVTLNYNF